MFEAGESLKNQRFLGHAKTKSLCGYETESFVNIKNEAFKKSLDFLMFAKWKFATVKIVDFHMPQNLRF